MRRVWAEDGSGRQNRVEVLERVSMRKRRRILGVVISP